MSFTKQLVGRRAQIQAWLRKRPRLVYYQGSWRQLARESARMTDDELAEADLRTELPVIPRLEKDAIPYIARRRRNLPHWSGRNYCYFLTCVVEDRQPYFRDARLAHAVVDSLLVATRYTCHLDAFVVMPDHLHLVVQAKPDLDCLQLFADFRQQTARRVNGMLKRRGRLWQSEGFDHIVRNQAYWVKYVDYIHQNPVSAGLCRQAQDFAFGSLNVLYGLGKRC